MPGPPADRQPVDTYAAVRRVLGAESGPGAHAGPVARAQCGRRPAQRQYPPLARIGGGGQRPCGVGSSSLVALAGGRVNKNCGGRGSTPSAAQAQRQPPPAHRLMPFGPGAASPPAGAAQRSACLAAMEAGLIRRRFRWRQPRTRAARWSRRWWVRSEHSVGHVLRLGSAAASSLPGRSSACMTHPQ